MKSVRKKCLLMIVTLAVAALMLLSFSACHKIMMRQENVIKRIGEAGATYTYEQTSPMTQNWQSTGHRLDDIILATLPIEGEETDGAYNVYIFYTADMSSADWVEEQCKTYKSENAEACKDWNVYRFEEMVMFGDYHLLSKIKGY